MLEKGSIFVVRLAVAGHVNCKDPIKMHTPQINEIFSIWLVSWIGLIWPWFSLSLVKLHPIKPKLLYFFLMRITCIEAVVSYPYGSISILIQPT